MFKQILKKLVKGEKADSASFVNHLRAQGARIGEDVVIYEPDSNFFGLNNPYNLRIGSHVRVTHGVCVMDHGYDWSVLKVAYGDVLGSTAPVIIGNNVFVGVGSIILKGVTIGNNVIIGAGSVVTHDIPGDSVAAGNPCKVIMGLDEYRQKRHSVQLKEAEALYRSYRSTHPDKVPNKEIFREYFWLFERPDKRGKFSCEEFDRVMHLLDGYELSMHAIQEQKPAFASYEDFLRHCEDVVLRPERPDSRR